MIVKLQRPIWPPDAPVLVYNQSRALKLELPMTPSLEAMFGTKLKIYCEAKYDNETLKIERVVDNRPW